MLDVTRDDARAFLKRWGITWCEDATNADTTRFRSALRADIIPRLEALRPGASRRASRIARTMDDTHALIDALADVHDIPGDRWPREALQTLPNAILATMLRRRAAALLDGRGRDRIGSRRVQELIDIIRGEERRPRVIEWPRGLRVHIAAREVRMELGKPHK
jgi:tRNA(Ile)-lysidine synthase TilS/MesJ